MGLDRISVYCDATSAVPSRLRDAGVTVQHMMSEEPSGTAITIVDFEALTEAGRAMWRHELASSDTRRARTLVLGDTAGLQAATQLLSQGCIAHFAGRDIEPPRILATVGAMEGGSIQLSDYVPDASHGSHYELRASADVDGTCGKLSETLRDLSLAPRLREGFTNTTEELLTNAIYNAPVDEAGFRRFAHWSRRRPVALDPNECVEVEFLANAKDVGVMVRDPFGSLEPYRVLQSVARAVRMESSQVEEKPGGAGLGIFFAFANVSHLIFNLRAGSFTEVIALLKRSISYREFASSSKSFDLFNVKGNHGR